jgi:hypothetical protein
MLHDMGHLRLGKGSPILCLAGVRVNPRTARGRRVIASEA